MFSHCIKKLSQNKVSHENDQVTRDDRGFGRVCLIGVVASSFGGLQTTKLDHQKTDFVNAKGKIFLGRQYRAGIHCEYMFALF